MRTNPAPTRRLLWAGGVAVAVVATAVVVPSPGSREDGPALFSEAAQVGAGRAAAANGSPGDDGHDHDHDDPDTKNAISRAGDVSAATKDPTTAAERRRNAAAVAAGRQTPDPELTTTTAGPPRPDDPQTRFDMANGCYALTHGGDYVRRTPDGPALTADRLDRAEPFFLKPTDLGTYLVHGTRADFLAGEDGVSLAGEPSSDAEWTVAEDGAGFNLRLDRRRYLAVGADRRLVLSESPSRFDFEGRGGCTPYPESRIGIAGAPFAGVSPYQEVRGYVDAHTHGMAFEFLGGGVHCGKPWDRYGAPYALVDCEDHTTTGGYGGVLESALSGEPHHDPVGWPTFKDWPAPNSLTHEGTYYRWLERSWRGGQRLFVNLLVENNKLCELYPLPAPHEKNSCDDMDSVRLQARRTYQMQDYIDAQFGGPGKGFYRIVRNPWQARKVINAGKMAVVMGIEVSRPFGCTFKNVPGVGDVPACDKDEIDAQLAEVRRLGVRQMELVNKFDNALSGIAGDTGEVGIAVNQANFAETGTWWDMRHCEPEHPDAHDKTQIASPEISADQQDALFGAIGQLRDAANLPAPPVYDRPLHCNEMGLTDLGAYTIDALAENKMLFDPDHMSVKARQAALDQLEQMQYPGVVSSHSWSTEDAYPRIYRLGGYIAPYAGDSTGFVEKWRKHLGWADPRFYFGFGYGADMNGLGAQGNPRGADVPNPVTYPFTGLGGVTVRKQRAGQRVYDINVDGVAQYGLYPDWIEDLRLIADTGSAGDGDALVEDMARGAEAYLQTWERAHGIAPDSCRNPDLRMGVTRVRDMVEPGMTTRAVLKAVGQPYTRRGNSYTFCARTGEDPNVRMRVDFTDDGRVTSLTRQG